MWIKEDQGLTTEQLAARCNEFLGRADAIKTSTLSGLFAGKRKAITLPEVVMFATALGVPVLTLMAPPWAQEVELRPGSEVEPVLATRSLIGVQPWFWGPKNPLHMWADDQMPPSSYLSARTETIIQHWRAEDSLNAALGDVLEDLQRGADELIVNAHVRVVRSALRDYHSWSEKLQRHALQVPDLAPFMSWVPHLDPDQFTVDFARDVLEHRERQLETMRWKTGEDDAAPTDTAE